MLYKYVQSFPLVNYLHHIYSINENRCDGGLFCMLEGLYLNIWLICVQKHVCYTQNYVSIFMNLHQSIQCSTTITKIQHICTNQSIEWVLLLLLLLLNISISVQSQNQRNLKLYAGIRCTLYSVVCLMNVSLFSLCYKILFKGMLLRISLYTYLVIWMGPV